MTVGLQVFNDSGLVQIDENYQNLQFMQKVTNTTATDFNITQVGAVAPVLVFFTTDSRGLLLQSQTISGTTYTWKVNGIGEVYVFDTPVAAVAHGTGLQFFNSNGLCVFDSNNAPMRVRDVRMFRGPYQYLYYYPTQTLSTNTANGANNVSEQDGFPNYTKPTVEKWGWVAPRISPVYYYATQAQGGPPTGDGSTRRGQGCIHANGNAFAVTFRDSGPISTNYSNGNLDWGALLILVDLTNLSGGSGGVTTAQSPGNQPGSGSASSYTFPAETVSVVGGSPSAYSWSILNATGGTWSIASGQGTSSAAAQVSGVTSGTTVNATQRCTTTVNGLNYISDSQLSYTQSAPAPVSVGNVNPGSLTVSGIDHTTFQAESVTVTGASTVSYSWTATGTGGTWSIASGANTFSCQAAVSGVAPQATANGTLTCTVVADGTTYTRSCTLSLFNSTAVTGVTFSPVPGSYVASDYPGLNTVDWSVTASQAVTWTWTKSGTTTRNTTTPTTSGSSSSSFSTTQTDTATTGLSTSCTVNLTASGAGSGSWTISLTSPGDGSGGGTCVTADTFLPSIGQALNVRVGDKLVIANPMTFEERHGIVSRADLKFAECVRIRTESGIELDCSTTAPIAVMGGELILAPDLAGMMVPVRDHGEYRHEQVVEVSAIGEQPIVHITCEDDLFLAGKEDGRFLLHHNQKA